MDLPQSNTDDCLIDLAQSADDLEIPPKPPYPKQLTKNGLSQAQLTSTTSQPNLQQYAEAPNSSNSLVSLQPKTHKIISKCNSSGTLHKISTTSKRHSIASFIGTKYSRAIIEDPSAGYCLRVCCRGWMTFLQLLVAFRAIIVRIVFLILTFTVIIIVVKEKKQNIYWLLCFLTLPLIADLCYSIRLVIMPKSAYDKSEKW